MKKAPLSLWLIAISYLALEVWTFFNEPSVDVVVRLILSIVLLYFLLKGSRIAGYIFAACCFGAGLIGFYAATVLTSPLSFLFGSIGAGCFALSGYILFSPSIRAFQESQK
jgi:hypothetical protein